LKDAINSEDKYISEYANNPQEKPPLPLKSVVSGTRLVDQFKKRNYDNEEEASFENFKEFIGRVFFANKKITLSPLNSNELRIALESEQRMAQDYGDGIQNILLMLYPIFMAEPEAWVLIDEPELSMHPGYQRLFMKTILTEKFLINKNLVFFIATHSNHLLEFCDRYPNDSTAFRFQYISLDKSHIEPMAEKIAILNDIGACNNSVCMANCSIWVEGPTDVTYIRTFLDLYTRDKEPKFIEGLDFCFFEYGGNLIANYLNQSEDETTDKSSTTKPIDMLRNANRIMLIADQDNVDTEKRKGKQRRFEELKQLEKDRNGSFKFLDTTYVEIENLLPKSVLLGFFKKQRQTKEIINFPDKDIARNRIGGIFESFQKEHQQTNETSSYANKNGSLTSYYKIKLARFVAEQYGNNPEITWDKMKEEITKDNPSHPLILFIEKIYSFIQDNNH
jgi:hypothetical protein